MNHEEVMYKNDNSKLTLSGTLSLPDSKKKVPAVILVHGMGPHDRDYKLGNHAFFLFLAEYLVKQGIAVLRFDKRGIGKSEGTFSLDLTSKDFADDVLAGIEYVKTRKEIDSHTIGLIGHSEGGMIAPMVAVESNDVSFLILMAGVVATSIDYNIGQVAMQLRADGVTEKMIEYDSILRQRLFQIIAKETEGNIVEEKLLKITKQYLCDLPEDLKREVKKFLFTINNKNYKEVVKLLNSKWYRFFLSYKPVETLKKIKIPILTMNGDLDFIVSSKISLPIINEALKKAKNNNFKIMEFSGLNHWFQICRTGTIMEYGKTEETISSIVLNEIKEWILEQVIG
jgi:alpha-beta hydrolase superfamily lysophospholipase